MWKRKIKIGYVDINVRGVDKIEIYTYKVKIIGDLGDEYQISFGKMVRGIDYIENLNKCLIFNKEKVYGIQEVELNWIERNLSSEWRFNRTK